MFFILNGGGRYDFDGDMNKFDKVGTIIINRSPTKK